MSYQETFPELIETILVRKPSTPQIKVKNPLAKNIFVNSIQLSFDAYFSEKGIIMIKVNNNIILRPRKAGAFARLKGFVVPMKNLEFLRQQNIEIFAWNGKDTDKVKVSADIHISEDSDLQIPIDQALPESQKNVALSDPETIFVQKNYEDETNTKLINMDGYKKLILILAGAQAEKATLLRSTWPNGANGFDLDLLSVTDTIVQQNSGNRISQIDGDYGVSASRKIAMKFNVILNLGPTFVWAARIFTSMDDVIYTLRKEIINQTTQGDHTIETTGPFTFRYVRAEIENENTGGFRIDTFVYEVYNPDELGGIASLSFEVKDASGTFVELISAVSIGAISGGGETTKQIGDVQTDLSGLKFNEILPSTQTDFRAKLIVVGKLATNIQIIKVS